MPSMWRHTQTGRRLFWRKCKAIPAPHLRATRGGADALLLVGTTVATHSAYRLVRDAVEADKPVILLNQGQTRADAIIDTRIGLDSSTVLQQLADNMALSI